MGYVGHKMSERAVEAYRKGEKPLTKWTKDEILKCIKSCYPDVAEHCSHFSLSFLRKHFLYCSSWHHTGKYYNKTDFYAFETDLNVEDILSIKETKKPKPEVSEFYPVLASWIEWEGTRNHPKPVVCSSYGRSNGTVFYSFSGTKKLCSGKNYNEFRLDDKELEKMKVAFKKFFNLKTTHKFNNWINTGGKK